MSGTTTCKACGVAVVWGTNDATEKNAPINATADDEGNVVWCNDGVHYHVLTKLERAEPISKPRFKSHFATCSSAQEFRKPDADAARAAFEKGKAGE